MNTVSKTSKSVYISYSINSNAKNLYFAIFNHPILRKRNAAILIVIYCFTVVARVFYRHKVYFFGLSSGQTFSFSVSPKGEIGNGYIVDSCGGRNIKLSVGDVVAIRRIIKTVFFENAPCFSYLIQGSMFHKIAASLGFVVSLERTMLANIKVEYKR